MSGVVVRVRPLTLVIVGFAFVAGFASAWLLRSHGAAFGTGSFDTNSIPVIAAWLVRNLGYSLVPFALLVAAFCSVWQRVTAASQVGDTASAWDGAALLDAIAAATLGVGVLWTAIGMRAALQATFGEFDAVGAAPVSALALLGRLVESGIGLALTTTIVGGALGYLMQLAKSAWLAPQLSRLASEEQAAQVTVLDDRLAAIERALSNGSRGP